MRVPAPTIFAALLLLVAAGFAPRVASAQPAEVSRVLRTIDFEERRLGNAEDLPMHWRKVEAEQAEYADYEMELSDNTQIHQV